MTPFYQNRGRTSNWLNSEYDCLKSEDKKEIDNSEIEFNGFDANNESKQLNYATFLCKENGRFDIFAKKYLKAGVLDSHSQMLPNYKKMLKKWKTRDRSGKDSQLKKSAIISVISTQETVESGL